MFKGAMGWKAVMRVFRRAAGGCNRLIAQVLLFLALLLDRKSVV